VETCRNEKEDPTIVVVEVTIHVGKPPRPLTTLAIFAK
jgi:hypothetical protein